MTALELIAEAEQQGLTLKATGNYLDVIPGRLCPPDFAQRLRAHKPELLALLRMRGMTWIEVYSERIAESLFLCEDEATRAALMEAGASEWSIYTRAELQILVAQNRIKPLTQAELKKVHTLKRTFGARIADRGKHRSSE
jgi:hypothetical protein